MPLPAFLSISTNSRHELPEQHEKLLVMLPPETAKMSHASFEKEIADRRAPGATVALVADEELLRLARETGLIEEGAPTSGDHTRVLFLPPSCPHTPVGLC